MSRGAYSRRLMHFPVYKDFRLQSFQVLTVRIVYIITIIGGLTRLSWLSRGRGKLPFKRLLSRLGVIVSPKDHGSESYDGITVSPLRPCLSGNAAGMAIWGTNRPSTRSDGQNSHLENGVNA